MKKYLILAATMLSMLACNTKNELVNDNAPAVPTRPVTLHATVVNPGDVANGPHRVAPVNVNAENVEFQWEANDQVTVVTNEGTYTVTATNTNGAEADFEGEVAGDLSNYAVYYGYNPALASQTIPYLAGSFRPCIKGTGANESFTLNEFFPVMELHLTGNVTLGKIEYLIGEEVKATMSLGADALALSGTETVVYMPVANLNAAGFTLRFYDNAATPAVVLEKSTSNGFSDSDMGTIVRFPVLNVESAPYEYVDLGLPSGIKWATCNVGATTPLEIGDYYAWGETETYYESYTLTPASITNGIKYSFSTAWKSPYGEMVASSKDGDPNTWGYAWAHYKFFEEWSTRMSTNKPSLNKYNYPMVANPFTGETINLNMNDFEDGKKLLEAEDDVAHVKWGGKWRTPTMEEMQELVDNCTISVELDGTNPDPKMGYGFRLTSKINGNFIIIPNSGGSFPNGSISINTYSLNAELWTATLYDATPLQGYTLFFSTNDLRSLSAKPAIKNLVVKQEFRYSGYPVRPVYDESL